MNDVKLTDFTPDQLQHNLDEVVAGIVRLERFPEVSDFIKNGPNSLKNQGEARIAARYENLCLWRTQLLNAISTVHRKENVTNN